jgi:PPE-repeat protein
VTVCGTSAAVLGTASGDCGTAEQPPGEQPPGEQPPGEEPPGQTPPGQTPPGQTPPDNGGNPGGGNNGDNNSGGGNTGNGDSGAGVPQTGNKASQASPIPNLSKTGADPLEFLLVGLGLMTAGVMARRGARRVTKA